MSRTGSIKSRLTGAFAAVALAACTSTVAAQPSSQAGKPHRPWAQTHSDLTPDPTAIFGMLPNGMKYAIRRNTGPAGQVAMRLVIDAGSMNERPDQAGVAHFLEHMAFRGSAHVPDGEVRLTLQRLGLRFGGDINASTSQEATTFMFNLARNDDESVDKGLGLLREIAGELSLDQAALDSERSVVLAELRSQNGPSMQLAHSLIAWQLGDHPYGRPPGGDPAVIQSATPAQLRAFYDAYYRPERATLVVVGDFNPDTLEQKVRRQFGAWKPRGPDGPDPAPVAAPKTGPALDIVTIPGVSGAGFQEIWRRPFREADVSRAGEMDRFVETVGEFAMRMRMRRMIEPADQPFESTDAIASADIPHVEKADVIQAFRIRDLAATLDFHIRARRQLAQFGLTQDELTETLTLLRAQEDALIKATSRQSSQIAMQLAGGGEMVVQSPEAQKAFFDQAAAAVTLDQVNASLRARLNGEPAFLYYGPTPPDGGEAGVRAILAGAAQAPVQAYAPPPVKPWTYTDFGPAGRIAEQRTDAALGVTFIRFANGVRLTVKSTAFSKNEALVKVRYGLGQLGMPRDALGPSDFGFMMHYDGGLLGYSENDLSRTLNGKRVAAIPGAPEDAFELSSAPAPQAMPSDQLELQLQRLAAMFTAPAFRPDHWASILAQNAETERSAAFSPAEVYGRAAPALLHNSDIRWAFSDAALQATWKPEDAAAWMRPIVSTAPLEVIIVGDVPVQRAIDLAARTFGALPPRADAPEPAGLRDAHFPAPTPTPLILRHTGPADQALVVINWPGTDAYADPRATQAANLLSIVLTNRLIDEIRIKQGKAYSPSASEQFSTTLPGYGLISARAAVQPEDAADVMATIDRVAAELAATDISADEFARAQGPRLEALRRSLYSNSWWMQTLSGAQTDPRRTALMMRAVNDTLGLRPADIRAAAQRWLVKDRSWRAMVLPQSPG